MTEYTDTERDLVFDWLRARTLDNRDARKLPVYVATAIIRSWAVDQGRDFEAWPNNRAVRALLDKAGYERRSASNHNGRSWAFFGLEVLPADAPDITE
ncbi:hypothetical protein [Streptomyces sp. OM5714]|uniref:hypothetical protein n=1 Tax=Streptomyces sp. OM5714 TaxID=2602736 RepID=UPI0013DC3C0B|nr:hypothetical protein [Streptomyces sp. OM5714]